ncbi:MAG: TatD family hydrolase [Chloroflexota bacterium]
MTGALPVFDTHVHLDQLVDPSAAVTEARAQGVVGMIAVGTDREANSRILELCQCWPGIVFPALGLHPGDIGEPERERLDSALRFIDENIDAACAVGEVGLDYHKRTVAAVSTNVQKDIFRKVLEIARVHDKAVLVHSRYAWTDALNLVLESGVTRAVFHWFTGFSSALKGIMEADFYISATPAVEYHEEHRRAVKAVHLDRLLLETDTPVWYGRSDRYQARPVDVVRSLKGVAQLRGESIATVAQTTTMAASRLLRIDVRIQE